MTNSPTSAGRRLSTITVDQAVSGASNVLVLLLAAHLLGPSGFGLFSIVMTVYALAQGLGRSLLCDPLLVHPEEAAERPGHSVGAALLLGGAASCLLVGAAILAGRFSADMRGALVGLAVAVPLLLVQDVGRYLSFATHRPALALLLDVVWLVLLFVGIAVLHVLHERSITWYTVAWAGSGALAGLLVFLFHSRGLRLSLDALRVTWSFSWRYLISYGASQGTVLVASLFLTGFASARELGGVRGSLMLMRPFVAFQTGSMAAGVAEVVRFRDQPSEVRRHARRTSGLTTLVALVNTALLLFLPEAVGKLVLGATWDAAQPLLLGTCIQMIGLGAISGWRSALLGARRAQTVMVIDLVYVLAALVGSIGGAWLAGAQGFVWGVAISRVLFAVVWWLAFRRIWSTNTPRHRA